MKILSQNALIFPAVQRAVYNRRVADTGPRGEPPTLPHTRIDAASVRAKALAANSWPWLNRILGAWLLAMLALCLGILAFAAVREMTIERRRELRQKRAKTSRIVW